MSEIEAFQHELKQYLNVGGDKRIAYGKNFYGIYFKQAKELGSGEEEARCMMERLVAFASASDGEINRSEYEFCNCALFEKGASDFLTMCKKYMVPEETARLRAYAKRHFEKFGHKSAMYIIGLFIIAANSEATPEEQKKISALFGLNA